MNKEILQKLRNNEIDLKRILKYLIPLTILLLVLVGIILFKPAIRGYVIGTEVASYVDNLNLVVDENKSYEWQLSHPGDITTLRVSGSLSKGGTAKVYLQYQSKKYLIFDSSQLLTSDLTPITGYAVLEGGESSENNQSIQNRDITERLVYNDGSIYDEDNNGIEPIEGVIDYSVKDSIFKWDVNYSNVCTKWEVNNGENSTFICYGAERCCDFIDLVPSRERWDDSFNLNYGKYGAGLNNTVSAQIVYVDYSLDPSNPYTDIRHSELASLKAIFQPELYSFKESCLETCLLANFNHSSYNLIFEIDNATLNIDSISYTIIQPVNVTLENVTILNETLIQYKVKINEPVKWSKNVKLSGKAANISFEVPSEALNISVYKVEKGIRTQSEKVLVKADNETARVNLYNEIHKKPKKKENITLIMEERVDEVEAEYYTEGPTATEEKISANKKRIIVNSEIHYENILAYTSLKTEAKASLVHLYWLVNNSRIQVNINKYDNNGNGLIDYVEWTVPSLSNQTYELVIEITKAEHLDENREFISDIYNEVYQLDGIWSETIPSEHYVRVTFEKLLDNTRDITLYPRVVSGNPKIEIYEVHGTKIVAEFFNLTSNEYNKVYLTSLQGSQDVFDLRVVNGSVEIDHIIDPAQTVIYYLKNGSTSYFDTIPPTGGHANTTCNVGANGGDCTYTWVRNESYSQTTNITTAKMTGRIYWNGVSGTSKPDYANIKSVSVINCSSPNCASYSTICQDAPANGYIDCYNIDTIGCNSTINCTPAAVTLATGQYLGFIVVAHSKSVDVKVRWNSSTLPAYFNVTELPLDTISPNVVLNSPINRTNTSSYNISFNFTGTDSSGIKNATLWANFSGTWRANSSNQTTLTSGTSALINVTNVPEGYFVWNVYVCDNATTPNCGFNESNFTIRVDRSGPVISFNSPANNTWQNNQQVTLRYTAVDPTLGNCTLYGNFNGNWQANQTNISITSGSQDSITVTLTNGTYLWNVMCSDNLGNSAFNLTNYTVSVDSIRPDITLNLPANNYNSSVNYTNFNWTVIDNLDTNLSCNLTINSTVNTSNIGALNNTATNYSVSAFKDGVYNWNITCWDHANNSNTSAMWRFIVDTTAPTTQLNAPANNTWQTFQSVTLQYTPSDGYLKNCTLYGNFNGTWQSNQTNTTVTSGSKDSITLTLTNGTYLWNVLCYDYAGNSAFNSTNYSITIDSIQPGITLNLPANGYSTSDTYINFNWTATDNLDNNLSCNLTINSIVNVSGIASSNSTATNQSVSGFTEGNYKWNTTCIDNAFNVNTSETRIFWIGVAPNVTNLNAIPQKALNGTTVIVNAIVTDNTAVSNVIAMFFYPNRSAWQNITMGNISTNYNTTITASFIPAGTYSVTIWANDSSNLVNNSESTWFAPYLNLGKSAEITIDGSFADWNETINVSDLLSDTGENNYIWNFSWGFGGNDVALGVATDTNNNFIVAGYNGSIGWRIMKFNSSNDNVWNFSIISGIAYAVATDTNNNFIVAGNNGTGWWIMKFNSSNDNVWNFNTDLGGDDRAMAIATDTNNNFIVAGYNESGTNPDSFIMKFNSSNDNIWNWTRNLGGYDKFQAVATDTNNNFIVAGYNGSGWLIRKFNSSNDNVWNFSNNFGVTSIAYAVATDKNSNFIVAGKNATSDWFIMEFNSSNDNIWNFSRDLGGPAGALGVATDTNNSFIVAGYNASGWWIMKFNSSNDNIWNWSGDLGGTSDKAQAVATDTNNNFIVAGNNGTTGNIDWFIMKFAGGGGVNFDLNKVSLSNNAQYLFARINVNGIVDYNNTAKKYRLYITKDESTGTATSPEGTVLAINYSYRIEGFNSSLWKVYNASNDNIFNASAANDSSSIELAINLTEINLSTSDSINVTFETAGYDYSFDFAPDYRSFLSYQLAETAVEGSPTLTLNSPLNNTWQQSQTVLFNYTPSGSNLDACVLYGDFSGSWAANETNSSPDNGQADTITLTLTNGTYTWNVMCNNTAGASAFNSTNYTFTIDTVQPGITLNAPVNSYNSSVNYINFNWTVTDNLDANLSCNITINSTVNMSNIGSSNSVATNNSVSGFIDSTYYWNISCIDHANNSNTSTMRRFTVDTTPPYFINLTNATIYDNESLYYDVNASDNGVGVHQFSINWTSTFSINATSGLITNISILNAGLYYINVTVNDTLNNRNSSILLVNVSATNSPPIIFYVNQTNITLVAGTAVTVNITFNVSDQDGFGNLDDSTAQANVTFNGVTRSSSSCTPNDYESIYTEYSCEVTFYYYDNASLNWVINATVRDNSGVAAVNDTVALQVKSLSSMSLIGNLTFSNIYLGEQDKTPDNDYILNNTGNFDFTLANITAYDLVGRSNPSYKIGVGNFTINTTDAVAGSGIQLQDGTSLNVTGAILPHKTSNSDANAIETIYFWLDVPDSSQITVQDYNSSIWQVIVS